MNVRPPATAPPTTVAPTTVALIDDHELFSASLAVMLRIEGLRVVVPELVSAAQLCEDIAASHPDITIVDRDLGAIGHGEALIEPITRAGSAVIVVSASLSAVLIGGCLAQGAVACIAKSEPLDHLLVAVRSITRGVRPVREADRYAFIDAWRQWQASSSATMAPFAKLTRQEASVLGDLMDGQTVKAIACEHYLSQTTIRTHVRGILTKLGVASQLEAIALARRAGWERAASARG